MRIVQTKSILQFGEMKPMDEARLNTSIRHTLRRATRYTRGKRYWCRAKLGILTRQKPAAFGWLGLAERISA